MGFSHHCSWESIFPHLVNTISAFFHFIFFLPPAGTFAVLLIIAVAFGIKAALLDLRQREEKEESPADRTMEIGPRRWDECC